jgi:hypothetical protein
VWLNDARAKRNRTTSGELSLSSLRFKKEEDMNIEIEDKSNLEAYAKAVAKLQGIPLSDEKLPAVVMYLQLAGRMAATLDKVELGLEEELVAIYRVTP